MNPLLTGVYITAIICASILFLGFYIIWVIKRQDEKARDGSFGLSQARAKAKADLIANETLLKLKARQDKPGYENVHVEQE